VAVPVADGVNVTEQLPLTNVQLGALNVPAAPLLVKLTVPVGAMIVPGEVSVTVTVQVEAWATATVLGEQTTAVLVFRLLTVTLAEPELPRWVASPP